MTTATLGEMQEESLRNTSRCQTWCGGEQFGRGRTFMLLVDPDIAALLLAWNATAPQCQFQLKYRKQIPRRNPIGGHRSRDELEY